MSDYERHMAAIIAENRRQRQLARVLASPDPLTRLAAQWEATVSPLLTFGYPPVSQVPPR